VLPPTSTRGRLITRQAIHRLGQHELEASARRVGDQCLDAGAEKGGAGNSAVDIFRNTCQPCFSMKAADAELAGDESVPLVVGG
jgi:hypothetical protein